MVLVYDFYWDGSTGEVMEALGSVRSIGIRRSCVYKGGFAWDNGVWDMIKSSTDDYNHLEIVCFCVYKRGMGMHYGKVNTVLG